jgi:riboflavin kinase/FMN adenylyltransferase
MAIQILSWHETPPDICRGGAVTVGNFDGVHRGHAALVAETRSQATALHGPAVALTFDPHPLQVLRPEQFMPVLTTLADRAESLQAAGADHVVVLRVYRDLLELSATEFFDAVLRQRMAARAVIEGPNFGFGRNRHGDVKLLADLCRQYQIAMTLLPPVLVGGVPVSSSRVRDALTRGAVREATDLLDRPYRMRGTVGTGQRRGQTLGFPTANLENVVTVVPGDGVYAARARTAGTIWPAAVNIGPNPTFGEDARKVEVHLIGFEGDLYGQELAVDFLDRLRDTRPFSGVPELVEQLTKDILEARRVTESSS